MRLLLDTHVLLWWLADDPKLSGQHRELISDGENDVLVSSISIAEVSVKASLGKLDAPQMISDAVTDSGFEHLPFSEVHAELLRRLPWHHRDPFDRMLIAQAIADGLALLSVDRRIGQYDLEVL